MKFDNKDRLLIHNKKAHSGRGERKKNSWDTVLYTTECRIGNIVTWLCQSTLRILILCIFSISGVL